MFKNQSMQARLIVAFIFMGLLVLIVALVGLSGSSRLSKHINTLAKNNVPSISGLWKINEGKTQIQSSERGLLDINLNKEGRQNEIGRMDNAWKQIQEGFHQYEATPKSNAEEEKVYKDFLTQWDVWKKAHDQFLRLNLRFESQGTVNVVDNFTGGFQPVDSGLKALENQVEANRQPSQAVTNLLLTLLKINEDLASQTEKISEQDVSQVGFWAFVAIIIKAGNGYFIWNFL